MQQSPLFSVLFTSISMLFDRIAYYGLRVMLITYLIEHLGVEYEPSVEIYTWFTNSVYIIPLMAGPIIDFGLGPRAGAIAGGVLTAFGISMFLLGNEPAVFVGLGLIAAGSSFSRLGNFSILSWSYAFRDNRRDIGFGTVYIAINIGAAIASAGLAWVSVEWGFQWGFVICAICALLGSGVIAGAWHLLQFVGDSSKEEDLVLGEDTSVIDDIRIVEVNDSIPRSEKKFAPLSYLIVVVSVLSFWVIYEYSSMHMNQSIAGSSFEEMAKTLFLNPVLIIILIPIFLTLLYFVNRKRMKLHYMWLIAICGTCVVIGSEYFLAQGYDVTYAAVVIQVVLFTIAEIVYPAISGSHITRLVNRKFTATALGFYFGTFTISTAISSVWITSGGVPFQRWFSLILMAGVIAAVMLKLTGLKKESF